MQVGSLYSCKWKSKSRRYYQQERGWDILMFLGTDGHFFHFYDPLRGEKCVFDDGLIKHCKELTKEDSCTQ